MAQSYREPFALLGRELGGEGTLDSPDLLHDPVDEREATGRTTIPRPSFGSALDEAGFLHPVEEVGEAPVVRKVASRSTLGDAS